MRRKEVSWTPSFRASSVMLSPHPARATHQAGRGHHPIPSTQPHIIIQHIQPIKITIIIVQRGARSCIDLFQKEGR